MKLIFKPLTLPWENKICPSYCTIFMALWEEQTLKISYSRFLDDIFYDLTDGIEKLNPLFELIPALHQT